MPKTPAKSDAEPTPKTTQIPDITAAVTVALANPGLVLPRLAHYETAESKDRHTEYKMSILSYALAGYIASHLDIPNKYEVQVIPLDGSVMIQAQNKSVRQAKKDRFQQEVPYPVWLASFFESDEAFGYLEQENTTPLAEVLIALEEHVESLTPDEAAEDEDDDEDDDDDDSLEDDEDLDEEDDEPDEDEDEPDDEADDAEYEADEDDEEDEDDDEDEGEVGEEEETGIIVTDEPDEDDDEEEDEDEDDDEDNLTRP